MRNEKNQSDFPFFGKSPCMEKKTKSAGTITIPALFRQKTGLMSGYFFKFETIDWQSRHFRYIVKDAVFFSKKSHSSIKTLETTRAGPLSRRRILFPEGSEP
jgi:bifunctional DNA-binding transcriptional regulator/antitoxin component of YhaV-PrlF toxin-antitoxin module